MRQSHITKIALSDQRNHNKTFENDAKQHFQKFY